MGRFVAFAFQLTAVAFIHVGSDLESFLIQRSARNVTVRRLRFEAGAMLLLREYSRRLLSVNLQQAAFGLFVAGLIAWLVGLYWAAPIDF